ncbi:hypothetical protein [Agrobacterium cavarae]
MNPEYISQLSTLITSASVLLGVMYAIFISKKILFQISKQDKLSEVIKDRDFHSSYGEERLRLERQIADLNIRLTQSMSNFEKVNHLIIDGQKRVSALSNRLIDPASFLKSLAVDPNELEVDRNLVFVLTPFHPSEQPTYAAIVEALTGFGIRVIRGDEENATGDILSHIIRQMLSARLVIANVNSRNSNVMYELGIAHALGKDVVMIANSDSDLPFDINSRRILFYSDHSELVAKLRYELARKIFDKS